MLVEENSIATIYSTSKSWIFVAGTDDFLVDREAQKIYERLSQEVSNDLSKEIIEGNANTVSDVETAVNQFSQAIKNQSLFGEKKIVWFRGINFLGESQTSRTEGTKDQLNFLLETLERTNFTSIFVIVSAAPVDRRTRHFKVMHEKSEFKFISGEESAEALAKIATAECQELGKIISPSALDLLISKIGGNSRLLIQEVNKLATYLGLENTRIEETLIHEMISQVGEGDFFEASEAFFSLDLKWTLEAVKRYFFHQKESRPLISALQNKNRLLIQLRVLLDAGSIKTTTRGITKESLEEVAAEFNYPADATKNGYNIFTQNPWYLGKLATIAQKISLRKLIDFQRTFLRIFEEILEKPQNQEKVLQEAVFKCLS